MLTPVYFGNVVYLARTGHIFLPHLSCHRTSDTNVPGIVQSFDDGFAKVYKGDYDYFYTLGGHIRWIAEGDYCGKLAAVGDSFFRNSISFVLPKNSPYTDAMSSATLELRELDLIPSSTDYVEERKQCPPLTNPTLASIVPLCRSECIEVACSGIFNF
jgi:hypothetical protein